MDGDSLTMKLSFVIPAHNEERYIGACLESVIAEAKNASVDAEIVVVNNASTDNTRAVAERFSGVRVLDESRKGTNRARETGFRASTGDLVANIDADTVITERWLSRALRAFDRDPGLVAFSGPYLFNDIPAYQRFITALFYACSYPFYLLGAWFGRGTFIIGGNVVINRTALEAAGGYNTNIAFYGDDTDTAIRLRKIGRVKFDYGFTIHSSSRRLAKEGFIATGLRYVLNYVWVTVTGKPRTTTSTAVREPDHTQKTQP